VKGKVRGEMQLTATRIIEHPGEIEVSVSSTTDMKIPIKLEIAKNRGFAEIRKYLDRVYQYIKEEEGKSII
jgi:selenocysteine-specific translation elongation factor